MTLRTGRVIRWTRDASGVRWAVVEPELTPAEVEREVEALIASLPAEDRRAIELERLEWAQARVRACRAARRRTRQTVA